LLKLLKCLARLGAEKGTIYFGRREADSKCTKKLMEVGNGSANRA
jgi:hypothetical protein